MQNLDYPQELKEYGKIHGHICFGLAMGYRAAKCAQSKFGWFPTEEEKVAVILGKSECTQEGIHLVTPCSCETNLTFQQEVNKYVFVFYHQPLNKAIHITAKPEIMKGYRTIAELKEKIRAKSASKDELTRFWAINEQAVKHILTLPDQELFFIKQYEMALLVKINPFEAIFVPKDDLTSCSCVEDTVNISTDKEDAGMEKSFL